MMWSFVHGIASMLATGYVTLDLEKVSEYLTEVYRGLEGRLNNGQNN